MNHQLPGSLLNAPVRVLVVGCGGTGSAIASGLPYLHQAIIARGHPYGLQVTLQDGETVSQSNCVRQPFAQGEIGHPKASVLATRMNLFWGMRWRAIPHHLQGSTDTAAWDTDLVIGCVDTAAARREIAEFCTAVSSRVLYWLDLGNGAAEGQYLLGQPLNARNKEAPARLQTAAERWPEILDITDRPNLPSCSAAEALTRQGAFVNQVLANHALSLLASLFAGGVDHAGAFVNIASGKASPIPIPAQPAPVVPKPRMGARARRRARRGAAV